MHIPLTLGKDRKKLSKRHGATQFVEFMRAGYLPEAMFNFLVLLGWSPGEENREILSVQEIIERFELQDLHKTPAIFDYDKLRWMNGEYIRLCDPERLMQLCRPFLVEAGLIADEPDAATEAYLQDVVLLIRERMHLLADAVPLMRPFLTEPEAPDPAGQRKWLTGADARRRLQLSVDALEAAEPDWNEAAIETAVNRVAEAMGISRAPVIHTVRLAVSGVTVGPGLFEMLRVLGRERVLRRLRRAQEWVVDA